MSSTTKSSLKSDYDQPIQAITDYVHSYRIRNESTWQIALDCLMDATGCGLLALRSPECIKHLGPLVQGTSVPNGARVPGTQFELDPVKAAFDIGTLNRWLDYNDTWLAAEWGHPSDNLAAILATADYVSRQRLASGYDPLIIQDVLEALVKAYEIQGVLALENSFNQVGLDHVLLVKLASTAVVSQLLGAGREEIMAAISQVFVDGQSLRTYRHSPNTGTRKSWAAGDAASRAVRLALITMTGEMGYPSVLSAKQWGFYDTSFDGNAFKLEREFGEYVIENILFKVAYPAEFHGQTAVECAVNLHPEVKDRLDEIEKIELTTQASAIRIISKQGALNNPADRDHCLEYMVAIGLIYGELKAEHYEAEIAQDPRIDKLRKKMSVSENKQYSLDYLAPDKRSIANSLQIFFSDGTASEKIEVAYPLGHKKRRNEGHPLLKAKFESNVKSRFPEKHAAEIFAVCDDQASLMEMPVNEWMDLLVI